MKFEKTFYVIISTILITAFILISYISSPLFSDFRGQSIAKIYFVDHITPTHRKLINAFNKKYAGQIEVVAINLSFDKFSTNERKELLARYLRSKSDRIDIFAVDQIWVPRFAKWGVPLEKYFDSRMKENFLKYALQSCYYKDKLVAAPLYIDVALMYYHPELLQSLPDKNELMNQLENSITWEDMVSLKSKIKSDNPFFIFPARDYEGLICQYVEMLAGQSNSFVENGTLKLNTPEAEKSLQLLVDMVNKYNMSPKEVLGFVEDPSYYFFERKKAFFLRGWQSVKSVLKKRFQVDSSDVKCIVMVPTPHFAGGKPTSVFGGWNLMISRYSTKVPESMIFMKFLVSEESQRILYEDEKLLPINNKVYSDSTFLKKFPEIKFFEKVMSTGFHRPALENYTRISDVLSYYIHMAIRNKITVKDALQSASKQIASEKILLK